jgi:hypothetical protein
MSTRLYVSNLPLSETEQKLATRFGKFGVVPSVALETAQDVARGHGGDNDMCYRLVSIDAAEAPEGCAGGDWFAYRIMQGGNGITGYRCGSWERVSADVQSIVTSLNGRRNWTKMKPASDRQRRASAAARRAAR